MNKKFFSFFRAFIIAVLIFSVGILSGVLLENSRVNKINQLFFDSETSFFDFQLNSEITLNLNSSCEILKNESTLFADRIFREAVKLEAYDHSNKLTSEIIKTHRRYDLLRTLLWENLIKIERRCGDKFNVVIYLYKYQNQTILLKGKQIAMSNKLGDLKEKYQDSLILIPIAVDMNLDSLDSLRKIYKLEKIPVIFINQKFKIENMESLRNIEKFLRIN